MQNENKWVRKETKIINIAIEIKHNKVITF